MDLLMDGSKSIVRDGFGQAILELGNKYHDLIVVTADLKYPTRVHKFAEKYPDRFYDTGVAEQNMIGVSAGLAHSGLRVFSCDYASFLVFRSAEQIRIDIAYTDVPVKIMALSSGLTFGEGGLSHQTIDDLSMLRALPNMTIVVPADTVATSLATCVAATYNKPIFLRIGRGEEYNVYKTDFDFKIGEMVHLREGNDITFFAIGPMVYEALIAAEILAKEGIDAQVYDAHTIKPIDMDTIQKALEETRLLVTIEEHSTIGGLGAAVLEALPLNKICPVLRIGIPDCFPLTGPKFEVRAHYGLDGKSIAEKVKKTCQQLDL